MRQYTIPIISTSTKYSFDIFKIVCVKSRLYSDYFNERLNGEDVTLNCLEKLFLSRINSGCICIYAIAEFVTCCMNHARIKLNVNAAAKIGVYE